MNKTLIFRKIGGIISELTEQYQYLAENPENINPLELELFIANSHFLAEHLAILKKLEGSPELLNQNNPPAQPVRIETTTAKPVPEVHIEFPVNEAIPLPEETRPHPAAVKEGEWFRPEPPQDLTVSDEESHTLPEGAGAAEVRIVNTPQVPDPLEESYKLPINSSSFSSENLPDESAKDLVPDLLVKEDPSGPTEADGKVPTLNEILSAGMNKENMAAKIISQEEKDLKSMIKLNDKLMFVRDLFGGYNLAYSEAIELVNRFDSFLAAENFLKQNYAVKNKWSEKQATVDQFYEILNRRFS
ncbi:hypothetical protein GZH53_15535 [Flavihumibacter sp. R14]|nr:hypothetical protein [Flavihumibacter soli]